MGVVSLFFLFYTVLQNLMILVLVVSVNGHLLLFISVMGAIFFVDVKFGDDFLLVLLLKDAAGRAMMP